MVEYDYDSQGRLTTVTRHLTPTEGSPPAGPGFITTFSYDDSSMRIASVTQSDGTSVSFTYDAVGRVSAVKDYGGAPGAQLALAYGSQPNSTAITDGDGQAWTYRHDATTGQLTEVLTPPVGGTGLSTTFLYDARGKLAGITDPNNNAVTYGYDNGGNLAFERDALGNTTTRTFSPLNQVLTETRYRTADPDGAEPAWVPLSPLDIVANTPVSYVVPAARCQSLTYSVVGGLPPGLSFDAATRTITGSSSAVGFYTILLRAADASGNSADRTVSVRIRTAATIATQPAGSDQPSAWRPADTSTLHSYPYYDGQGRVVGAVDEQQFLTETVYDDALNTQRTLRYLAPVTVAPGDNLAPLKSRAGASRQISLVQYDDFGRVREVSALDGSTVTRNEYDEAGRLTRVVSAANTSEQRVRCTFYNAFGDVTATLGGEGSTWLGPKPSPQRVDEAIRDYGLRYKYDTLGRMVRSVDANGNRMLFYYNRESRRTHTVHVIGQSADDSLAGMDQLLADGGGQSLLGMFAVLADASVDQLSVFEYNRCGRLVKQVDGENGFTENIYNAYGDLAAQVRSTRDGQTTTKQFDYDLNGRVVSQTDDVGGINANTRTNYDAFGRVIRSVDGAGRASTTAYHDSGRSIVVTDPLQGTTRTEYDALSRVSCLTNALGQQTDYAYDETARSVTATTASSWLQPNRG